MQVDGTASDTWVDSSTWSARGMVDDCSKRKQLEPTNDSHPEQDPLRDAERNCRWNSEEADCDEPRYYREPNPPPPAHAG